MEDRKKLRPASTMRRKSEKERRTNKSSTHECSTEKSHKGENKTKERLKENRFGRA